MKKGEVLPVYKDWQNDKQLLGFAELLDLVEDRSDYTFIVDDEAPSEAEQIVYAYQE